MSQQATLFVRFHACWCCNHNHYHYHQDDRRHFHGYYYHDNVAGPLRLFNGKKHVTQCRFANVNEPLSQEHTNTSVLHEQVLAMFFNGTTIETGQDPRPKSRDQF